MFKIYHNHIYLHRNHPSPSTATCTPNKHIERTLLSSDYKSCSKATVEPYSRARETKHPTQTSVFTKTAGRHNLVDAFVFNVFLLIWSLMGQNKLAVLTGQAQFSWVNGRNHKYTVHRTYPAVQLFLIDKQPEYTYRVK